MEVIVINVTMHGSHTNVGKPNAILNTIKASYRNIEMCLSLLLIMHHAISWLKCNSDVTNHLTSFKSTKNLMKEETPSISIL